MASRKINQPVSKARTNSTADVAESIADKSNECDRQLVRVCEAANKDADVLAIEREMDALSDEIAELWIDAPSR